MLNEYCFLLNINIIHFLYFLYLFSINHDQNYHSSTLPLACVQAKRIDKQTILIHPHPLQEVAVYVCLETRMGYKEKRNHAILNLG
mgnify:FL=1